jgi:hypothetical protein
MTHVDLWELDRFSEVVELWEGEAVLGEGERLCRIRHRRGPCSALGSARVPGQDAVVGETEQGVVRNIELILMRRPGGPCTALGSWRGRAGGRRARTRLLRRGTPKERAGSTGGARSGSSRW